MIHLHPLVVRFLAYDAGVDEARLGAALGRYSRAEQGEIARNVLGDALRPQGPVVPWRAVAALEECGFIFEDWDWRG